MTGGGSKIPRRRSRAESTSPPVIDILIGNGDSHLKNWAFTYGEDGKTPRLSPAYDMVPTVLFIEGDELALKLGGKRAFRAVTRSRRSRVGSRSQRRRYSMKWIRCWSVHRAHGRPSSETSRCRRSWAPSWRSGGATWASRATSRTPSNRRGPALPPVLRRSATTPAVDPLIRSSKGHTLVVARVLDDEARAPTPA
ncbi:HipA domain-containing protein [Myxococcota bacterium]|nr:HipA domain-containing protein [Myxococcota bacterium]